MRHLPIYSFHLVAVSYAQFIYHQKVPPKENTDERAMTLNVYDFLKASGHSFPMKLQRPLLCAFQQCMDVKVGIFSIS